MERILVLIRHAKSDWAISNQTDFERPLNARGKRDAPEMGKRLKKKKVIPDLIISSPAVRAATTAKLIAAEVGYDEGRIRWVDKLYHCQPDVFEDVLTAGDIPDDVKTVLIFAHNPGISQFAYEAAPSLNVYDMPTCAMVGLTFKAEHWSGFSAASRIGLFFDFPKNQ